MAAEKTDVHMFTAPDANMCAALYLCCEKRRLGPSDRAYLVLSRNGPTA